MIVAIHQPNYLPWLGYFRKIAKCELFVFFDNARLPLGKSVVSRNAIKTASGRHWLTVPIEKKPEPIADIRIADQFWRGKHMKTLAAAYAKAPCRALLEEVIEPVLEGGEERIADVNIALIRALAGAMGIDSVEFVRATELDLSADGRAAIPEILARTGARRYVTGTGAGTRRSIDPEALARSGIAVEYISPDFPEYAQLHGPFVPNLSAVDALLNLGPERTRTLLDAIH